MEIVVGYPVKKELTVEQLELYLEKAGWSHFTGGVWQKKSCYLIFSERLQQAIDILALHENRASGLIYDEIMDNKS